MRIISKLDHKGGNDTRTFFRVAFSAICVLFGLCVARSGYAKDITILYTGDTHAMLYTCSCPVETDGGVARRATLLASLRKDAPDALLFDSGASFAGGMMDEWGQNTELDKARTVINLRSLGMMKYDAVAVGVNEFNFGRSFLYEQIQGAGFAFITCNVKSEKFLPYIIKEVGGLRLGITAVTALEAMAKSEDLTFMDPKKALMYAIQQLKSQKVDLVVLLCALGREADLALVQSVEGIDVAIMGRAGTTKEESSGKKVGSTIVVWPSWQGRHVNKLTLKVEGVAITDFKNEEIRLSDKIKDAPEITAVLPKCFSEAQCKKAGFVGTCVNPGTMSAQCVFTPARKIKLTVVTLKDELSGQAEVIVNALKQRFPGLEPEFLYYPEARAKKLVADLQAKTLPVFLLSKDVEKEQGFDSFKESLESKSNAYLLKPRVAGIMFYLQRPAKPEQLDLFIGAYEKRAPELLQRLKEYKPTVHFLAVENKGVWEAMQGPGEAEESMRMVCVQKYAPAKFLDYLNCRSVSSQSAWWEDCLQAPALVPQVRACAKGQEAKELLRQNTALNRELQIMYGPTYLMGNQEIFSSRGVPTPEELKKLLKK